MSGSHKRPASRLTIPRQGRAPLFRKAVGCNTEHLRDALRTTRRYAQRTALAVTQPVLRQESIKQRSTQCSAQMMASLAPIYASATQRPPAAPQGIEIDAKLAQQRDTFFGEHQIGVTGHTS